MQGSDMTDELVYYHNGSYKTEFVSGDPKNYAYKVYSTRDQSEHTICKVKEMVNVIVLQMMMMNN